MSNSTRESIYEAIASIRLIDPHTHINPHAAGSTTFADLLGYHYYTELAHSAGMPKDEIEEPGIRPRERVRRLVDNLSPLENTAQYHWLIEICRTFFGFDGDRIDASNWESLYDAAESKMAMAEWPQMVLDQSNVEAVFLTNDFDDDLAGFDTDTYIPCLRTDDLVFHLSKPEVRQRLAGCTGIELDGSLASLRASLRQRFEHFVSRGARACAISLPPSFTPAPVGDGRASTALDHVLRQGILADDSHKQALSRRVFWTLAELCDEFGLPFDLMIGVNRGVYSGGVYQGQDLYDSRVSLIQYRELFNAFPAVKFPVSVLASVTNQELVSYAWIFPNVITNGHWWYSNTPSFIARDAAARLEAVPQTKQIGYYSDAYKLEFVRPKFDMYRRILAGILADQFVGQCGWSEERAIELGRRVLRSNIDEIFTRPAGAPTARQVDPMAETWSEDEPSTPADESETSSIISPAAAAASASLAAGAIGMVEIERDWNEEDDPLADRPTLVDFTASRKTDDTVRIDKEVEEFDGDEVEEISGGFETVDDLSVTDETEIALDPLPSADEIKSADVDDVELSDPFDTAPIVDADSLEEQLDNEPLDLGDMFDEDESPAEDADNADVNIENDQPTIQMLRSEDSFEPDEDSLRLTPDPTTGELTFAFDNENDDELTLEPEQPVSVSEAESDLNRDADEPDLDATIEITEDDVVDSDEMFEEVDDDEMKDR